VANHRVSAAANVLAGLRLGAVYVRVCLRDPHAGQKSVIAVDVDLDDLSFEDVEHSDDGRSSGQLGRDILPERLSRVLVAGHVGHVDRVVRGCRVVQRKDHDAGGPRFADGRDHTGSGRGDQDGGNSGRHGGFDGAGLDLVRAGDFVGRYGEIDAVLGRFGLGCIGQLLELWDRLSSNQQGHFGSVGRGATRASQYEERGGGCRLA
jgi:hypothetical protein